MRLTRTTALVFAVVTVVATAASPSPAGAFFFPFPLLLGARMTVNPDRVPSDSTRRGYTLKPGKPSSRDEDSKPSKSSGTKSRDEDSKRSKASAETGSKEDDGKRSYGSGKGAKSAAKAEANANSGHGGWQTQRRWSVEHEATASKSSGRASTSIQRVRPSANENSDTRGASVTGTQSNIGDFDENLGQARMDDLVEQPPK